MDCLEIRYWMPDITFHTTQRIKRCPIGCNYRLDRCISGAVFSDCYSVLEGSGIVFVVYLERCIVQYLLANCRIIIVRQPDEIGPTLEQIGHRKATLRDDWI